MRLNQCCDQYSYHDLRLCLVDNYAQAISLYPTGHYAYKLRIYAGTSEGSKIQKLG